MEKQIKAKTRRKKRNKDQYHELAANKETGKTQAELYPYLQATEAPQIQDHGYAPAAKLKLPQSKLKSPKSPQIRRSEQLTQSQNE